MQQLKIIDGHEHIAYRKETYSQEIVLKRSDQFYHWMNKRRTVREFSNREIPRRVIDNILLTASTAPSGAHKQPWTFCIVSDPHIKSKIRKAAEREEYQGYSERMSEEWLEALKPIGTDWRKPFLEVAPYLIIVFKRIYEIGENGEKKNNYYVNESLGLACGFLLTAIHNAGLVALTHTPSPMNFLAKILQRPENERPFLLIPMGYPAEEVFVPKLERKSLKDIAVYY